MEKEEDITELKEEIKGLRDSPPDLKASVDKLLSIFEGGVNAMEDGAQQNVAEEISKMEASLAELLHENTVIAKGIVKLTDAVTSLSEKLNAVELSVKGVPEHIDLVEEDVPKPPTHPKHRVRKQTLDRIKREFDK